MFQTLGAYARLMRLSNGPTAIADVWMGYAVASGGLEPTWPLALVTLASLCLYHAGMVGNDLADALDDRAEGRDRPIATGAVRARSALRLRRAMECVAMLATGGASLLSEAWWPVALAAALWTSIRLYNSPWKRTLAGPPVMGLCRGLNVTLGASVAGLSPASLMIALGVACYIDGVTLFARDERREQGRGLLAAGGLVSVLGVAWLALWPVLLPGWLSHPLPANWPLFWCVTALLALRGMAGGLLQPTPRNIGRGIGIAIQGLVVIDATLATLYAGPVAGLAVLALLPVTMLMARSIPQT